MIFMKMMYLMGKKQTQSVVTVCCTDKASQANTQLLSIKTKNTCFYDNYCNNTECNESKLTLFYEVFVNVCISDSKRQI